jgi:predicted RNase H-like HicB family nuclease
MKQIKVTVEKTNTGFSAGADKYPVYTAGDSLEEIKTNITEALNLYFEYKAAPKVTEGNIKLIEMQFLL